MGAVTPALITPIRLGAPHKIKYSDNLFVKRPTHCYYNINRMYVTKERTNKQIVISMEKAPQCTVCCLHCDLNTPCLKKVEHFYVYDNFGKSGPNFVIFFTVKFRKDLRRKMELKLPPPLKSVATLPCERQVFNFAALQQS